MSYILDALRRADAERGRGGVPGLHTQATPVPGASPAQRSSASASLAVVAAAVLVVAALAAGGTWWAMQRNAPSGGVVLAGAQPPSNPSSPSNPSAPATPVLPVTTPPPTQTVAPVTSASPAPANPSPAAAAVPAPPPAVAAEPRPAERRPVPPPREKPAATVAAQRAPVAEPPRNRAVDEAPRDRTPSVASPLAARTQEPAATPAPTGTVFAQSDLPDAVRTQLPVLKISGATYSANPMHRMAIVNGQVLHEGDVAAPGLLLEKIEPTRTIWSFKGYRYGLASQ